MKANIEVDRQHAAIILFFGNNMVRLLEIDQAAIIKELGKFEIYVET